jgi:hypothetical protein
VLVLGHSPRFAPQEAYGPYEQLTHRRVGDSCFSIYERVAR